MIRNTFFSLLLAALVLVGAAPGALAREPGSGVFNPETFTLDNGMQVVVVTMRRAPVVLHRVWYRVGAADEPAGQSGIAHFLEHLMFKETENLENGEFSRIVANNGGQQNAFTAQDYTAYYQFVARDRLEIMMRIEADRMTNLVLSEEDIRNEREVIIEERRSRTENNPHSLLFEQVRAALFQNHPYGIPVIGWMHEMQELGREETFEFYRRHYAPNNAILLLVGDVTAEEVRPLVEATYGQIPRGDVPERVRPQEPPQRAARRVEYRDSRAQNAYFVREYIAPSYLQGETGHAHALQLLADILGSGNSSRLYQTLVVEQRIATTAAASYSATRRDLSTFGFYVTPASADRVAAVEQAVDAMIADVVENGVTEEELANAKRRMLADAVYARDSHEWASNALGSILAIGGDIDMVERWPERIDAVTRDEVRAAARHVLQARRSVTGILLPAAGETAAESGD